jgi:CRISPR/Cas system-associated exonuclease Cas4 (RecB family)
VSEFTEILNFLEKEENKIKEFGGSVRPVKVQRNPPQLIIDNKNIEKEIIKKSTVQGFDSNQLQILMRDELIKEYHRIKKYAKKYISVTELITCPRKVFYNIKNYPINLEEEFRFANLYLIKKIGNDIHNLIQKIYKFDENEKTVISEKFNVKGRVDAILDESVIELKTTDKYKYQDTYEKIHYYQGIIYAYLLNNEYGYKINNISIVYIFRDLKTIKVHNLLPDHELAKSFLNRSLIISDCLNKNTVPSITDIPEEECQWCSYKKYCNEKEPINTKSKSKFLL